MKRNRVSLTEEQLHQVIAESVCHILRENGMDEGLWDYAKSVGKQAWNGGRNGATNMYNRAKQGVQNAYGNVKQGVQNVHNNAMEASKNADFTKQCKNALDSLTYVYNNINRMQGLNPQTKSAFSRVSNILRGQLEQA